MALEELERVCKGHEEKMASLKAALRAGQPASPATIMPGLNGHHAKVWPPANRPPSAPSQPLCAVGPKALSRSSSDMAPTIIQTQPCQKVKAPNEVSPAFS